MAAELSIEKVAMVEPRTKTRLFCCAGIAHMVGLLVGLLAGTCVGVLLTLNYSSGGDPPCDSFSPVVRARGHRIIFLLPSLISRRSRDRRLR